MYKFQKHFGLSFAYNAPRISDDLPDDVHSVKSLSSFRKKLKSYFFAKAYQPKFFGLVSFFLHDPGNVSGLMIMISIFWFYAP